MFSPSGTTQSDTINRTAGNTQTNPAGSVYQRAQGTAETTLTSSQLPTRSEGSNTRYQIDPAVLLQATEASDGCHQTCIISPSLYTGGTPLVSNFPMSEHSSQLVTIGQSLPLLPQKLVQQIQAGEFVDFGELPPAKGKQLAPPTTYTSQIVLVQLQEVSRHRRLIPDYNTWSQCFAIYTAVMATHQPHRIPELMAYQTEIAKCAKKYKWPSWVIYDINFRQDAAANPTRSWAFVHPSMYTQCFTDMGKDATDKWCRSCQSLDHTTSSCPVTPPPPKTPRRERIDVEAKRDSICRNYNSKGCTFPKCVRRHVCSKCGEKHPATRCKDTSQHQALGN